MYARALVKTVSWRLYIRKTSSLSDVLSTGTWTEITSRILSAPPAIADLEWEVGSVSMSSMSLTGVDIAWWKANVFDASDYIELKIIFTLGLDTDACSDLVYAFSGFLEKDPQYNELADSVAFNASTAQDIGNGIPAEKLSIQYVNTDIDGAGTDGLILPNIPLLFVKDAGVTDYFLKIGTHTIGYKFTAGSPDVYEANLDGGEWVTLSNGDNTLGNAATPGDDTERVMLYVADTTHLPKAGEEIQDSVIVVAEGDTLPRQWHRYISVRAMLRKIFAQVGIETITFDTLEMDVAEAGSKVSFLDAPPNDDTIWDVKYAMVSDGTDLWIAVRNRLYKRNMVTGEYTLKATLTSGRVITRLWYDETNDAVWVYSQQSLTNEAGSLLRHTISTAANSSEISLPNSNRYSIELFPGWGLVYVNTATRAVRGVDFDTLTEQLIITAATLGYGVGDGPMAGFVYMHDGHLFIQTREVGVGDYYHELYYDVIWEDGGKVLTLTAPYQVAAFDDAEDRIYFYDGVNCKVKSHPRTSATETELLTLGQEIVEAMVYTGGKVYVTTPKLGQLWELESNNAALLNFLGPRLYTKYFCFAELDGRIYGIDEGGRLYHYADKLAMYIPLADFSGSQVTGALNAIVNSFQLLSSISSTKQAFIYRRGNSSGAIQTTGNALSLTITDVSQILETIRYTEACGLAVVDNGSVRYTYDGSVYNVETLSDVRRISIDSPLVPNEIVQDLCHHIYQYFKTARTMYVLDLGCVPLFQYEPCDGLSVDFTATKIQKTSAAGVIYGTTLTPDGSMQVRGVF
jgi:hypothetical protein